jgi:hypothetical protein
MKTTEHYTDLAWKGKFINNLIQDLNYKKYLELGVANAETWNQISCECKLGVDLANNHRWHIPGITCLSTDEFFQDLGINKKFDLIYIDACHEKTQVKEDFYNSWNHLNENGVILLHDVNPPSKEGTSQSAHGDCFELWIEMVEKYPKNVAVFNAAPGTAMFNSVDTLGVYFKFDLEIQKNEIQLNYGTFKDHTYEFFVLNHPKYNQRLSLSYDEIVRAIRNRVF